MSRRASKGWLAVAALAILALAIVWFLTRSGPAPSRATGPLDAPVPAASSAPNHALDVDSAPPQSERTTASTDEFAETVPAPMSEDVPRETLIHGSVLDEAGAPIARKLSPDVELSDDTGRRRRTEVSGDGTYAFRTLPLGTYWLSASADGFRRVDEKVELRAEQPQVRQDFKLAKAVVIKVKLVTPDGGELRVGLKAKRGPARAVLPIATRDHPGSRFFEVRGSLNNPYGVGNFWNFGPLVEALPAGYMGVVVLRCELPAYVSLVNYHVVLATQRVEPGTDEVVFVLSQEALNANVASVRVRTIDSVGRKPVAGAIVMVSSSGSGTDKGAATDASGLVTLEGLAPGRIDLSIGAAGYGNVFGVIDAEPGVLTDLGDVVLDREVEVHGRFVDEKGEGVKVSYQLGVLDPASGKLQMDRNSHETSTASGEFTLSGLGRKQYVLRTANHDAVLDPKRDETTWVSGHVLVDVRAGPISGLVIRLQPASLLVLRVLGESPDGLRFRVDDQDGRTLVADRFYGPGSRPLKLPPGPYQTALLDERGNVLAEKSVTLRSQTVEVELAR